MIEIEDRSTKYWFLVFNTLFLIILPLFSSVLEEMRSEAKFTPEIPMGSWAKILAILEIPDKPKLIVLWTEDGRLTRIDEVRLAPGQKADGLTVGQTLVRLQDGFELYKNLR